MFGLDVELLERDAELERLSFALDSAGRGSGRVVLVTGEAGIGKSALVRAFADSHSTVGRFLVGTCDDLFASRPLSALRDMGRIEPDIAAALAENNRDGLFEAVLDLAERSLRPTVFVIEDAHWADEATLDLVRFLGRRIGPSHGLLILTYRDNELPAGHPLRTVLGDLPPALVDRLAPAPLTLTAIEQLVPGTGDADQIHSLTGGNPFLVTELLSSRGDDLPSSIVDSVSSRVGRLSNIAKGVAELVSVVPGRADLDLIVGYSSDWQVGLDECDRLGLLYLTGAHVAFRHEIARRAIEGALPAGRRVELNRIVLAYLLANSVDSPLIVHHGIEAGDASALLEHSPHAARAATSVGAHREAFAFYETLASLYEDLPAIDRATLLHEWSISASMVNQLDRSDQLINEAIVIWRRLDEPRALGSALRWRSRVAWLRGQRTMAEALVDEAVAVLEPLGPSADLAHAYSAQAQLAMLANQADRAVERAGLAIETARPLGEDEIIAHAQVNLGSSWTIGTYPENTEAIRDAIDFARRKGFKEEMVRGMVNYAWGALLARDLEIARGRALESVEAADDAELAAYSQYARGTLALIEMLGGHWPEAEEAARSILDRTEVGPTTRILAGAVLGTLHGRRGIPGAEELLEEAWDLAQSTEELQRSGIVAAARAEVAWIAGRHRAIPDLVRADLSRAVDVGLRWMAGDLFLWGWLGGHQEDVPSWLPEPYALLLEGKWEAAADAWETLGMPYERAIALGLGNESAVLEAIASLDGLGARPVADRFRAKLRAMGVRGIPRGPTHQTQSHPAGLTPRQAEVLLLVAEGLTNQAIAERLFISARTVDHHVSTILAKLAVSSRSEAVDMARRLGVLHVE